MPVDGALIRAGLITTSTDINGNFVINDAQLKRDAGYVTVEKEGYFTGSRMFVVHEGASTRFRSD
jgi:hypothetical protein